VPVLFSRLRSGRTYYSPEFTDDASATWEALRSATAVGVVTPVLGPDLAEPILGSRHEMAASWVERWQMPLATHTHRDLAQVAQYLRVRSADGMVRTQLLEHIAAQLRQRADSAAPGDPFSELKISKHDLQPAILQVGKRRHDTDDEDPYRLVAQIRAKVFVTTGWTNLLEQALTEAGKNPISRRFVWENELDPPRTRLSKPDFDNPLVYHLFGDIEEPDSLVLTEDDYFRWLTAWLRQRKDIPLVVRSALTKNSLLFLGFQLEDWDFRVIFHAIKSFEGSSQLARHQHAGVQISPVGAQIEPEAAKEYLESYFGEDKVDIYWGRTKRFLSEFHQRTMGDG
jgi:hypothetical protein